MKPVYSVFKPKRTMGSWILFNIYYSTGNWLICEYCAPPPKIDTKYLWKSVQSLYWTHITLLQKNVPPHCMSVCLHAKNPPNYCIMHWYWNLQRWNCLNSIIEYLHISKWGHKAFVCLQDPNPHTTAACQQHSESVPKPGLVKGCFLFAVELHFQRAMW